MTFRFSSRAYNKSYCTYKHALSSRAIRSRFLDFFLQEKGHTFVKSSPVASYFDATIPFTNAGMCQFKGMFTGEEEICFDKVANTQKCIRIGGKHNDLNLIGVDSYHHTFFEMLGNWSFNSYDKREACTMAWQLLTSAPYNIPPDKLFITYFGGSKSLNLPADEEVREIWLELGVPSNRILPFGIEDNFWEIGSTGPCGTCTEIHVALDDCMSSRSDLVNKNNPLLAELWNIVFIRFNRTQNLIEKLPNEFIDTGMGLERLTALLQRKTSNYDTDLFVPLMDKISEISRAPKYSGSFDVDHLDNSYRCLADFSRMITVAIADQIYPDVHPKFKRVLRKALYLAKYKFQYHNPVHLLSELSNQVAEMLHDIFPEIGDNLKNVKLVVENEHKIVQNSIDKLFMSWNGIKTKHPMLASFSFIEYPGLPVAFDYILKNTSALQKGEKVPSKVIHYLYDTYGLDQPIIQKLVNEFGFKIDWNEVEEFLMQIKASSRQKSTDNFSILSNARIQTDTSPRDLATRTNDGSYVFPEINANLLAIVDEDRILSTIAIDEQHLSGCGTDRVNVEGKKIGLIFDKSNFFVSNSSNIFDVGEVMVSMSGENIRFDVFKVENKNNIVFHWAKLSPNQTCNALKIGSQATLKINNARRMEIMRNYTSIHLLLIVLRSLFPLVYFKTCFILPDRIKLTCRVLGKKFVFAEDKRLIEEKMKEFISNSFSIKKTTFSSSITVLNLPRIIFTPGDHYPTSNIQLLSIVDSSGQVISNEMCCHQHLLNTKDLNTFEVMHLNMKESSDLSITARSGVYVSKPTIEENELENNIRKLSERAKAFTNNLGVKIGEVLDFNDELTTYYYKVKNDLRHGKYEDTVQVKNCILSFDSLRKSVRNITDKFSRESVVLEISSRVHRKNTDQKFTVYLCLLCSTWFKHNSFIIDIIYRNKIPTVFMHFAKERLSVACFIPEPLVTEHFDASTWVKLIAKDFELEVFEEDDMRNYCFAARRIREQEFHEYIDQLLETSRNIAVQHLK